MFIYLTIIKQRLWRFAILHMVHVIGVQPHSLTYINILQKIDSIDVFVTVCGTLALSIMNAEQKMYMIWDLEMAKISS